MTTQISEMEVVTTGELVDQSNGDHDLFSHYVTKQALGQAIFDGIPCKALCGKMWLPTKDAQKYPVCPECKEKWEAMPPGE